MKKAISVLFALVLCFSLAGTAFADGVTAVPSPQKFLVNGEDAGVFCEIYNINNYNYFKLRDIAALLEGTEAQFAVGYDNATRTVTVTTGGTYTWTGNDLNAEGSAASAKAELSNQTLTVDGKTVTGLSVYNINGSNYFKLRELGDLLGFTVDYDGAADAATVEAKPLYAGERPLISRRTEMVSFTPDGVSEPFESFETTYGCDLNGNRVRESFSYFGGPASVSTVWVYDSANRLTEEREMNGDEPSLIKTYIYDAAGRLERIETKSPGDEEPYKTTEFTYVSSGSLMQKKETQLRFAGTEDEMKEWTYTSYNRNGDITLIQKSYFDMGETVLARDEYNYDANGVLTSRHYESTKDMVNKTVWDETYTYEYDDGGNCTRKTMTDSDGHVTSWEMRYNRGGRMYMSIKSEDGRRASVTLYAYDLAGKVRLESEFSYYGLDGSTDSGDRITDYYTYGTDATPRVA